MAKYYQWRNKAATDSIKRLSEMLIEDPVVRVEEFEGVFALAPRSHIFSRVASKGNYEPELTDLCRKWLDPKRDAVDVGANVGFHTVLFARRLENRRVLAVEPTKNALARLKRNLSMNNVGQNVILFEGVASDDTYSTEIKTIAGLEEYSTIGQLAHHSVRDMDYDVQPVEASTIDRLVSQYKLDVGLMKVDVEGAEHLVFKGAVDTLKRCRPVVISELSDVLLKQNGATARDLVEMFEALDYAVTDPRRPGIKPGGIEFGDVVCFPKEHPGARRIA